MSGSISVSHLSTQYITVPLSAPHDPTLDGVQFAFLQSPGASPQAGDWVTGGWSTGSNTLYPYNALCLIGPNGSINLGTGSYVLWVKVSDNPETPIWQVGQLTVT